ncbi:MAG: glycosyltransferase family 2 protein [Chryseobacterium taeanense]|jgi:glycosyltransferase involved in cell wall biosynthesis
MMSQFVSIIITTYNSADFITETLESVKAQIYQNIELIISDDASQDETVSIAGKWLQENADRFVRTDLITVSVNTGVSANCNRSIAAAKSDWIKFIAGDDILLPNCIEDNVRFVQQCPEAKIIFSQVKVYRDTFKEDAFVRVIPLSHPMNIMAPQFTAADQFNRLLLSDRINFTPSYFFNKDAVVSVGGYDETNRFVEDYPMWLKLTQAGYKLFFFEVPTVGYRQHDRAFNNVNTSVLVKPSVFKSYPFRKKFVHTYLPVDMVLSEKYTMSVAKCFAAVGWNKNVSFYPYLYLVLTVYFNPFKYVVYLRKILKIGNTAILNN